MKKLLLSAILAPTLVGCTFLHEKHPLLTASNPVVSVIATNMVVQLVTNEVVKLVVVTNTIVQAGQTVIQLQTNTVTVPQIVQIPIQVPVYVTNWQYTVSSSVTNAINTVEGLSPLLPEPIGGIVSLAGGIGGVLLGLYAKLMSGKYKQVISAVAAGVETGADNATKVAIQNAAAGAGVQHLLDPIVQAVSAKMADPPVGTGATAQKELTSQ